MRRHILFAMILGLGCREATPPAESARETPQAAKVATAAPAVTKVVAPPVQPSSVPSPPVPTVKEGLTKARRYALACQRAFNERRDPEDFQTAVDEYEDLIRTLRRDEEITEDQFKNLNSLRASFFLQHSILDLYWTYVLTADNPQLDAASDDALFLKAASDDGADDVAEMASTYAQKMEACFGPGDYAWNLSSSSTTSPSASPSSSR